MTVTLVPLPYCDTITVKTASELAGVSGETIRTWCRKFGIGRKPCGDGWERWAFQVSLPGLRMVIAQDWQALEAFRAGDRASDIVSRHFEVV
ncbi:MAG: hypothetical protein WBA44_11625 [Mesorhizobium sp.]